MLQKIKDRFDWARSLQDTWNTEDIIDQLEEDIMNVIQDYKRKKDMAPAITIPEGSDNPNG